MVRSTPAALERRQLSLVTDRNTATMRKRSLDRRLLLALARAMALGAVIGIVLGTVYHLPDETADSPQWVGACVLAAVAASLIVREAFTLFEEED